VCQCVIPFYCPITAQCVDTSGFIYPLISCRTFVSFLATLTSAAMDIRVPGLCVDMRSHFSRYRPQSRLASSCGNSAFSHPARSLSELSPKVKVTVEDSKRVLHNIRQTSSVCPSSSTPRHRCTEIKTSGHIKPVSKY
jgi:hypothetical protein